MMKTSNISFLIVMFLIAPLLAFSQEEQVILWNGKAYSGRINARLKDGRNINGRVRGGVDDQSARIIPDRGGVEITIPFSQIEAIDMLPYDPHLENRADVLVRDVESAIDSAGCEDSSEALKTLDAAVRFYREAILFAREADDKNRLNGKISRIDGVRLRLKNMKKEVKVERDQEQSWISVLEARDRLDFPRHFSLLLSHLDSYPQDQRAHAHVSDKIIKHEQLPIAEKSNSLTFIGKYLQICARHKRPPENSVWNVLPVLFKDLLESLKKPGGYETIESCYGGATSIICIINDHEDLRASLSPWSAQALSIDPKEYLYNSAVNEVRQGQVNAGEKIKFLLASFPTSETYELIAEWSLYNHNIADALIAYQEMIKQKPGGDPQTERLVNILNFLQEVHSLFDQGNLEKARDDLTRVWDKKDDLPPPLVKMIYNMVAQCDLLILDQKMNQRIDKEPFYDFILERLAYFANSYFSQDFFNRFKDVVCVLPVRYEFKIRSQNEEIIASSMIANKVKNIIGQKEAYGSRIVVILEMSLDVDKDLDSKRRTYQVKYSRDRRDSADKTIYYKDKEAIDWYLVTKRKIDGRLEIKSDGYGVLYNHAFRKNHQERKLMTTVQSDDVWGRYDVSDTQSSKWLARDSSSDAIFSSSEFISKSLEDAGIKSMASLLKPIRFDPERRIELPPKPD